MVANTDKEKSSQQNLIIWILPYDVWYDMIQYLLKKEHTKLKYKKAI